MLGGVLLVLLGVFLLLDATETVEFGEVFSTYWPVLLIAWGGLAIRRERGRSLGGTIVLLLGVGFLLENLEVFADDWLSRAWPVAIILLGLSVVIGAATNRSRARRNAPSDAAISVASDWVEATAVLSGRREAVTSRAWRGGTATAVMGAVDLDLRNARPVAEGATLRTTAVMGGVEVRVPRGWVIAIRGTPLLGGFEDKTQPPEDPEGAPLLTITGTAIMGGVEVKH